MNSISSLKLFIKKVNMIIKRKNFLPSLTGVIPIVLYNNSIANFQSIALRMQNLKVLQYLLQKFPTIAKSIAILSKYCKKYYKKYYKKYCYI